MSFVFPARQIIAVLALTLLITQQSLAFDGPPVKDPENKLPSFPIDPAAEAFIGKFDRTALLKDEVFLKALQDLAKSDLSAAAKADAFALMQQRIGWLFVGASRIFPGMGYAQTQAMVLTTYFQYQQKMPKEIEVGPLLDLARTGRADHPLRSSNALLMAIIVNPGASREAVQKAIDLKAIEAAPVPAIDLHNLALAAALTGNAKVVAQMVELLPKIESDESREDLIVITVIYKDDHLREMIEDFAKARFPGSFDNSVKTALGVLAHLGPEDHFRNFYKSLGQNTKDPKAIDLLRKLRDDGFGDEKQANVPGKSYLKIWDGFSIKVENDGGWIATGPSFRFFLSFE